MDRGTRAMLAGRLTLPPVGRSMLGRLVINTRKCPLSRGGLNRSAQHFILKERWSVVRWFTNFIEVLLQQSERISPRVIFLRPFRLLSLRFCRFVGPLSHPSVILLGDSGKVVGSRGGSWNTCTITSFL